MLRNCLLSLALCFLLQAAAAQYYLIEQGGCIAAVTADGSVCCVTDTPLSALLPADRAAILQGFPCADRAALERALENFCS